MNAVQKLLLRGPLRIPWSPAVPKSSAILGHVTAKETLLQQAPGWTEEQAERALRAAAVDAAEFAAWLAARPPLDDEPWAEVDEAAVAEVRADRAAGSQPIPFDEIKRKYGLA